MSSLVTAPGKKVLVVDDDADLLELLSAVLRGKGLTVDTAADGLEAIELLAANAYSVVLLDLVMPRVDGFGVIEVLSKLPANAMPVVLVITGADRPSIEQLDSGVIHGLVRKPCELEEIAALVLSCTEVRERGSFETMALAVLTASPLLALLSRMGS